MKLLSLLRRKVDSDHVVVQGADSILVRDEQVFGIDFPQTCTRFFERVLTLDGVSSITVDRGSASATIRFSPSQYAPAAMLERMAAALSGEAVVEDDGVLRHLLQGIEDRMFTVFRHDHKYSRSPIAVRPPHHPVRGIRRLAYLALAGGSFAMSVVGVLVPGIPTVPFVLLTSYYLVRSSPPLNERLLRSRTFGTLIRDWQEHGGMRPRVKAVTLTIMLATATISVLLTDLSPPTLVVVLLLICLGAYSVLRLPTVPDEGNLTPLHRANALSHE